MPGSVVDGDFCYIWAMTARQLYNFLGQFIEAGCADYEMNFMEAEKYPHSIGSVSPDHAGRTVDLWPYGEEEE